MVREVREELGVVVEPTALLAAYRLPVTYLHGDQVECTALAFRCRVIAGEIAPVDGEILEWEWVPPAEVVGRGVQIPEHVLDADYPGPAVF